MLPGADLATCAASCRAHPPRDRGMPDHPPFDRREVLPGITVSIGVAQFQGGETMADLIDRCDRALYLAKKTRPQPRRDRERARSASGGSLALSSEVASSREKRVALARQRHSGFVDHPHEAVLDHGVAAAVLGGVEGGVRGLDQVARSLGVVRRVAATPTLTVTI